MNAFGYPIVIQWSVEDNGFIAVAPDLPGCSAFGVTVDEVLSEIQDAISAWLDAVSAVGNSVPLPFSHHHHTVQ